MDVSELERQLVYIFDQGVVFHAFADYMRDYEVVVHCTADPSTGIRPAYLRYLFRYCVHASIDSTVSAEIWARSLDERLIEYESGVDLDGYVWGVKWHMLYPGARVVADSPLANEWSTALGIESHEVEIESNAHRLRIVFSDLNVTEVDETFQPVVLHTAGWPDGKIPLGP